VVTLASQPTPPFRRLVAQVCDVTPVQVRVWFHNRRHREKCKSRGEASNSDAALQQDSKLLDEGHMLQWLGQLVQARQQSSAGPCCLGAQAASAGGHSTVPASWCNSVPSGGPQCPVAYMPASAALPWPPICNPAAMPGHQAMWLAPYMGFGAGGWHGVAHGYPAPYPPHMPQSSFVMGHGAAFPVYPPLMNFPGGTMLHPYATSYRHGFPSYGQRALGQGALLGANRQGVLPSPSDLIGAPMTASTSTSTLSAFDTVLLKDVGRTRDRDRGESIHRAVRPRR
jgi:hypothetical protein